MLIKIPIKLASEANSSEHWTKSSKRHRQQKLVTRAYINKHLDKIPVPCVVTLTRHSPRPYDCDNNTNAFKYVRDAVSEAILNCKLAGRADSDPRIKWQYGRDKTSDAEYFITIKIKPYEKLDLPNFIQLLKSFKKAFEIFTGECMDDLDEDIDAYLDELKDREEELMTSDDARRLTLLLFKACGVLNHKIDQLFLQTCGLNGEQEEDTDYIADDINI